MRRNAAGELAPPLAVPDAGGLCHLQPCLPGPLQFRLRRSCGPGKIAQHHRIARGFSRIGLLSRLLSFPGSGGSLRSAQKRHPAGLFRAHQLGNLLRRSPESSAITGCWWSIGCCSASRKASSFPRCSSCSPTGSRARSARAPTRFLSSAIPVTVTWMAAVTGYLIRGRRLADDVYPRRHSVGAVGICLDCRGARPARRGAWLPEESSEHLTEALALEQASLPQYANFSPGAARARRTAAVLPILLLELRRLRPCDLDSGDDSLRIGARHRADWPSQRRAISSRRRADARRRNFLRSRAPSQVVRVAVPDSLGRRRCFALSQRPGTTSGWRMSALVIAGGAMYAPYGPFFAIMPEMLPRNVAGEVIALVNSCGALGGFAGTWLVGWLQAVTGSARAGFLAMSIALIVAGAITLCLRRPKPGANRVPRKLAVNQPPDAERILVLQLVGQRRLGKILVADGPHEAIDRVRAHRSRAAVARCRIRPAMHHRVANFDARGKAVHDEPSRLALQDRNEIGKRGQIGFRSVQRRGQLALPASAPAPAVPRGCRSGSRVRWGRRLRSQAPDCRSRSLAPICITTGAA